MSGAFFAFLPALAEKAVDPVYHTDIQMSWTVNSSATAMSTYCFKDLFFRDFFMSLLKHERVPVSHLFRLNILFMCLELISCMCLHKQHPGVLHKKVI